MWVTLVHSSACDAYDERTLYLNIGPQVAGKCTFKDNDVGRCSRVFMKINTGQVGSSTSSGRHCDKQVKEEENEKELV